MESREARFRTGTSRHGNGNVGVDEGLAARGDRRLLGGVQIVAGGVGAATRGELGLFRELLDQQRRLLGEGGHGGAVAAGLGGGGHGGGNTGCVVGGVGSGVRSLDSLGGRRGGW